MSGNTQGKSAIVFKLVHLDNSDSPPQFGRLWHSPSDDSFQDKRALNKPTARFDLLQNPLLENYPLYPSTSYHSTNNLSSKLKQIESNHKTSWILDFTRFSSPILAGAAIGLIKGNHWGSLSGATISLLVAIQKVQSQKNYLQDLKSIEGDDLVSKKILAAEQDLTAQKIELFINPICFAFGATAAEIFEKQAFRFFSKNITCKIFAQSLLGGIAGGAVTAANPRTRHFSDISVGILGGSALGAFGGFIGYRIQRWNQERISAHLPNHTEDAVLVLEESTSQKLGELIEAIDYKLNDTAALSIESLLRRITDSFREPHEKIKDLIGYLQHNNAEKVLIERLKEMAKITADPSRFEFTVQMYQAGYEIGESSLANSMLNTTLNWLHFHTQRSPATLKGNEIESIFLNVLGRRPLPMDRILAAIKGPQGIWEKLFSETLKEEMKQELVQRIQEANFYAYLYSKAILDNIMEGRKNLTNILREYNWAAFTKS